MIYQFFRNARFVAGAEIILKLKGLIFIPLLTRYFGPVNYGVWSQVSVVISTIGPLIFLGTHQAFVRYLPGRPLQEQKRSFTAWILMLLVMSILICGSLLFWKRQVAILFFGQAEEYEIFLPLVAATLFVSTIRSAISYWYQVHNDARMFSLVTIEQALFGAVAVIVILLRGEGVYELVIYSLLGDTIFFIGLLIQITYRYGWAAPDFSFLSALLRYGLPLFPSSYALWGLNSMDRIFLISYATLADVGIYNLVYALGYLVIPLLVRPFRAMYPNSAAELYNKGDLETLQKLFNRSAGVALALSVPAAAALSVLGKPIITFVATEEFVKGAPLVGIIAIGYIFHLMADYYEVSLGLVHRQYWSTVSVFVACGVNLVLNILLIPKYSIWGAAVATNFSFMTQLVLSYLFAYKHNVVLTNFDFPIKIVLASVLMGIIIYVLQMYFFNRNNIALIGLLSLSLVGFVSYISCLLLFKVISKDILIVGFSILK